MLRSEMAIFLQKAFRLPLKTGEPTSSFVDIPEGASYAEAVESILDAGITRGCSADPLLFCPNDTVNRDTMASFLAMTAIIESAQSRSPKVPSLGVVF